MRLTDEQLDWVCKRLPDPPRSPYGVRPTADQRTVAAGSFWILANAAKWQDLPRRLGSKSTVHRWFKTCVEAGAFGASTLSDAARFVERRGEYRLHECFIDGSSSKATGGGDGTGGTKVTEGIHIMVLVDARGSPVAVHTAPANHHGTQLVQRLFEFALPRQTPERVIKDEVHDSDALDAALAEQGIEPMAPHRANRRRSTPDGRPLWRMARR